MLDQIWPVLILSDQIERQNRPHLQYVSQVFLQQSFSRHNESYALCPAGKSKGMCPL